jgi:hypothetical protein
MATAFQSQKISLRFNPTPVFLGLQNNKTLLFKLQADRMAARLTKKSPVLSVLEKGDWGLPDQSLEPGHLL